jgi:hypothetical protein
MIIHTKDNLNTSNGRRCAKLRKERGDDFRSRDGDGRAVVRAIQKMLKLGNVKEGSLKKLDSTINSLASNTIDDRVKLGCAKLQHEIAIRTAELQFKIYEHDNPAVQRSEVMHKGLTEIPSEITFRVVE